MKTKGGTLGKFVQVSREKSEELINSSRYRFIDHIDQSPMIRNDQISIYLSYLSPTDQKRSDRFIDHIGFKGKSEDFQRVPHWF